MEFETVLLNNYRTNPKYLTYLVQYYCSIITLLKRYLIEINEQGTAKERFKKMEPDPLMMALYTCNPNTFPALNQTAVGSISKLFYKFCTKEEEEAIDTCLQYFQLIFAALEKMPARKRTVLRFRLAIVDYYTLLHQYFFNIDTILLEAEALFELSSLVDQPVYEMLQTYLNLSKHLLNDKGPFASIDKKLPYDYK